MFNLRKYLCIILSIFTLLLIQSCKDTIKKRNGFKQAKILTKFEKIDISISAEPYCVRLLNDSVILVNNTYWNNTMLVELYSLKNNRRFSVPIVSGKYKQGIPDCICILNSNADNFFKVNVMCDNTIYTVNADSILKHGIFCFDSQFSYLNISDDRSDIFLTDSMHYVAHNIEYINDSLYNNGYSSPLFKGKINPDTLVSTEYNYVNSDVNGVLIFFNNKTKEIWSADLYSDKISIYDNSLNVIKTIDMHENIKPSYVINDKKVGVTNQFIKFKAKKIKTFTDYFITSNHVYLTYVGRKEKKSEETYMEVFKLDLYGNLITDYIVNRYIYSISVDKSEKYLYCLTNQKGRKAPVLLKYEL
ncbi:hypothetical protein [Phocaeicola paurosaccharolyticus]|jgi:hypothetical protein|uniref:hypothetical protein n=1 Tax=Phocaeicola paurosaccharolyticus TaxID=732242 RepID=UPI0011DD3BD4|nr:hypothetical protein [Phocaeicola paurosaccharolyticus]